MGPTGQLAELELGAVKKRRVLPLLQWLDSGFDTLTRLALVEDFQDARCTQQYVGDRKSKGRRSSIQEH